MSLITCQSDLDVFCAAHADAAFIVIDTEFLREKTYYAKLCLVQIAGPEGDPVAIDPLAEGLDLAPLLRLMANPGILKVLHAGKQDLEIFWQLAGAVPAPVFDSQIAAAACGFGDQIGYDSLVSQMTGVKIDKASQFTDWSRRPLTDRQLTYALADVEHLRTIYPLLRQRLESEGRLEWVEGQMLKLTDPAAYDLDPEDAWKRIKIRSDSPRVLAALRALAAWREREARHRDIPRGRILRDETVTEIALHLPKNVAELERVRGLGEGFVRGRQGQAILKIVEGIVSLPESDLPRRERKATFPQHLIPAVEMLKMLLRICCAEGGVTPKLVASPEDLETLALNGESAAIPALEGWRREMFGEAALHLLRGNLALTLDKGQIRKISTT